MKRYNRAYFDKWYREPRHRVHSAADLGRRVRLALGMAEYMLMRPVRTVLDVGCGEGEWRAVLRRERPAIRYTGVDPSEYVVRRFGARRDIRLGSFGALAELELEGPYDLIVCSGVLNYLPPDELAAGLLAVRELLAGVAYLEIYAAEDSVRGDVRGSVRRPAAVYRRLLRRAGLTSCGAHCYVGPVLLPDTTVFERAER